MKIRTFGNGLLLSLSAILASCGGGGGGNDNLSAGIDGSGISSGTVTGFGSIFVNGIEFETNTNDIKINGNNAAAAQLKLGQVVTVIGSITKTTSKGNATSIRADALIEGMVDAVNSVSSSFTALGQTVVITPSTVFDGTTLIDINSLIASSSKVSVYGFVDHTGQIVATRIESSSATQSKLHGVISSLNTGSKTFSMGATGVNYSAASIANGTIADGACAEVKGTFTGVALVADSVEVKTCGVTGNSGQLGEVEGFITSFVSATNFSVGGTKVTTSSATTYVNGTVNSLVAGVKLEVEGNFNSAGVLVASKCEIKLDDKTALSGPVTGINPLKVMGMEVRTTNTTLVEDKTSSPTPGFNIDNLQVGNYVQLRGAEDAGDGFMTATRLERDNPPGGNPRYEITAVAGPISGNTTSFRIMGVTVTPSGAGLSSLPNGFYNTIATSRTLVRVRGTMNTSQLPLVFDANDSVQIQ